MEFWYIGQILLLPYNFTPTGCVPCDGRALPTAQNQALFAVIGTIYGGNQTNFNIPNLKGMEPVPGVKYYIVTQDSTFPVRS